MPSNLIPSSHQLENNKCWHDENHTMEAVTQIDWQECMAPLPFTTIWHGRKINHANQFSHSRLPFPPFGSVSKHNTVATVIPLVNTANKANRYVIHLFIFFTLNPIHASNYWQGVFIPPWPEQTVVEIQHNNPSMQFMWVTELAPSIHTPHVVQARTQKRIRRHSK